MKIKHKKAVEPPHRVYFPRRLYGMEMDFFGITRAGAVFLSAYAPALSEMNF